MKNYRKSKKGMTLIELIIAMSLMSIVSITAFSLLFFSAKVVRESDKEVDIQHSTRMVLYETSDIIRYSTAVFTIPRSSFRTDNLDAYWDYIGINEVVVKPAENGNPEVRGHEIVRYTFNPVTKEHDAKVLLHARSDVTFSFVFDKINPHNVDSLLQFTIEGFNKDSVDEFGQPRPDLSVTTEVEARNSLQVIDYASPSDPAFAVAFRSDVRQKSVVGHISMVLDTSGSMADDMNGLANRTPTRISILKTEANKLIDGFALEDNIDISLVPFSTSANTANNRAIPFYNAQTNASNLKTSINALTAVGGTNTGDGLRRAYHAFVRHNGEAPAGVVPKNYLIVLVDGVTTFASVISNSNRNYFMNDGNVNEGYLGTANLSGIVKDTKNGQIVGTGTTISNEVTGYVNAVGNLLRSGNFAKTYVIGFSAVPSDRGSINDIATACGAPTERVFSAASQDDLSQVFAAIQQDIVNDLWFLQGPQL